MDSEKHSIGKTIAKLRKEKGYTQLTLAEALHVTDKAVSKWEQDLSAPSIEILSPLATLLGVSIDYLLTGKEPEKEIVLLSKLALCAKNDDVDALENIPFKKGYFNTFDENNQTILSYAIKYQSKKLIKKLVSDYSTVYEHLLTYFPDDNELFDLASVLAIQCGFTPIDAKVQYFGENSIVLIVEEIENNGKSVDSLIHFKWNLYYNKERYNSISLLNWLIAVAAKKKKMIALEHLLERAKIANGTGQDDFGHFIPCAYVTEEVILSFLENGEFDIVRKMSVVNRVAVRSGARTKVISEHDIEIMQLRLDGTLPKEEIELLDVLFEGLVDVTKLLATNNPKLIIRALSEYPVHRVQIYANWLDNNDFENARAFALETMDTQLVSLIDAGNKDRIEEYIAREYWQGRAWRPKSHVHLCLKNMSALSHYAPSFNEDETILTTAVGNWQPSLQTLCQVLKGCTDKIIEKYKQEL